MDPPRKQKKGKRPRSEGAPSRATHSRAPVHKKIKKSTPAAAAASADDEPTSDIDEVDAESDDDAAEEQQQFCAIVDAAGQDVPQGLVLGDAPLKSDSGVVGRSCFASLLAPLSLKQFYTTYWEKTPVVVRRRRPKFYGSLFSSSILQEIMRNNLLKYGVNIDVVEYVDGVRETVNPDGRVKLATVMQALDSGCSVRMLNPHTYHKPLWHLLSRLQDHFNACMGVNVYWTPPGAQGFAPHYDDIEAFVLQIEGSKRWRLYAPRHPGEQLALDSSRDFRPDEIGEALADVVLNPGDLMYFPRGCIHQAVSCGQVPSLHLTLSTYQHNSWSDLLSQVLPRALRSATERSVELRSGLPLDYASYTGAAATGVVEASRGVGAGAGVGQLAMRASERRRVFMQRVKELAQLVVTEIGRNVDGTDEVAAGDGGAHEDAPYGRVVDASAETLAIRFVNDSLPPVRSAAELAASSDGAWPELTAESRVRLLRRTTMRVSKDPDGTTVVHHNVDNARVFHGEPPQSIAFPADAYPLASALLSRYPAFVTISSLADELPYICESADGQNRHEFALALVTSLYENGLLVLSDKA